MRIDELCAYAQNNGYDKLKFRFTNLRGEVINCQWLDAYMGLFRVEGDEGFITVGQWKELTGDCFEFEVVE